MNDTVLQAAYEKFLNAKKTTDCYTANRDPAYKSSGDLRIDLFYNGTVRGCSRTALNDLIANSWNINPEDTIKILMNGRDIRGGKGERAVSYTGLLWLRTNKPMTYLLNLATFINLGCYKDLLYITKLAIITHLPILGETT